MIITDGKKIAQKIRTRLKKEVEKMKKPPILAVILVGDDPASHLYVRIKEKISAEIGIVFQKYLFPSATKEKTILELINRLNNDKKISAIIVQLPLPAHLDSSKIIEAIAPEKDADSLTGKALILPPTPAAILTLLANYKISLKNKNIVLVGHGKLVGGPLAKILKRRKIPIEICTDKTKNLSAITKKADILISATGVAHLIKADMVKKNAVIIDAGTSESGGEIVGDVDFEPVKEKSSYITPPKGGIGPVTVAKLMENVVKLDLRQN